MSQEITKLLWEQQCLQVRVRPPFTYASGLKGPMYCDNRLLMSDVPSRNKIVETFSHLVKDRFLRGPENLRPSAIVGVATAGIAYAAWLAHELSLPLAYVRSEAKKHGKGNRIEGRIPARGRILVVEDLVNQGQSSASAIDALQKEGYQVLGLLCIVNYQFPKAEELMLNLGVPLYALTDFSSIIEFCRKKGLPQGDLDLLKGWHDNPQDWQAPNDG